MTVKFERFVLATGGGGEIIHRRFNVFVYRVVPRVGRFTGLEISVRIGGGAANDRMLRVKGALAMLGDFILRQQGTNGVIRQRRDFVDFVRGAETIKKIG